MTRMEPFRNRQAGKLSGGMKQKLGLMCTLLHRPEILFLDEPSNGVDPVSRRDFWAILYQLVKDGITVLVTTAYLDEAERCNRVGLMYKGRLIQCDAPDAVRHQIPEDCYQVEAPDPRGAREVLLKSEGVLCVEPSGATLHLFLKLRPYLARRAGPPAREGRPRPGGFRAHRAVARGCLHRAGAQGGKTMTAIISLVVGQTARSGASRPGPTRPRRPGLPHCRPHPAPR